MTEQVNQESYVKHTHMATQYETIDNNSSEGQEEQPTFSFGIDRKKSKHSDKLKQQMLWLMNTVQTKNDTLEERD